MLSQAQYFRDPDRLDQYFEMNGFLPDINNEIFGTINATYLQNFLNLNKLVLILFSNDKTVVPKESSWFGSYEPTDDLALTGSNGVSRKGEQTIIPMRLQPVYLADTFGLRTLDERGDVLLETCEGEHMQISEECWKPLVKRFVGGKL